MSATVSLRAYTGTGAGTESASITELVLCAADALTGGDVLPGTVSYERWLALKVDVAPAVGIANFWLQNTGDLPVGVELKFGIANSPATPVNTASTVAVNELQSGRKYIFDVGEYADVGDRTRYVVIQEIVAADADSGDIPEQDLVFGWTER